jgi:pantoate--beta-alanine ligase
MKVIKTQKELKSVLKNKNTFNDNKSVGFIPTMGALHLGHLELIKQSKLNDGTIVVSIFVNPTQFLEGEDFEKYPRQTEKDIKLLEDLEVDILFLPTPDEIYFDDEVSIISPKYRGFILEGASRIGHFNGVLQVVMKLLMLVKPDNAYFGKKDAQQYILIKQMARDFFLNVNILGVETVREKNGLAMSSRNVYLSEEDKSLALNISKSLKIAENLIESGEKNIHKIEQIIRKNLLNINVEYVKILSQNLTALEQIQIKNTLILIAVKIKNIRLIDNIWI